MCSNLLALQPDLLKAGLGPRARGPAVHVDPDQPVRVGAGAHHRHLRGGGQRRLHLPGPVASGPLDQTKKVDARSDKRAAAPQRLNANALLAR